MDQKEKSKYRPISFNNLLREKKYFVFLYAFIVTLALCFYFTDNDTKAKINFVFKAHENDVFQFFYIMGGDEIFSEKNSISKPVVGQNNYQRISFSLPDKGILKNIRLDPGINRRQHFVDIKSVYWVYREDSILLFDGDKVNCFITDETVERHNNRFILKSTEARYDPQLSSSHLIINYGNLTADKDKLPAIVLLPFGLAVLVYLFFFADYSDFKKYFYSFASCFFVLLLLVPGLNNVVSLYKDKNREKRVLTERPILKMAELFDFPGRYEMYFNDNFGFKSLLVKIGGKVKYSFFNASSVSNATIGKEGWMYLNSPVSNSTDHGLCSNTFSDSDLFQLTTTWEERKGYLESKGIRYYKAFWPEKHMIYPEYLPWQMKVQVNNTESRIDQVLDYLKEKKSDLQVLDVTKFIVEQKKGQLLYLKHDSHWNDKGAFIAYTKLLNTMSKDFPELKPYAESDFEIKYKEIKGGEISDMIGLEDSEMAPDYKFKGIEKIKELPYLNYPLNTFVFENKAAATNLTLLIFRDSFTRALTPFLNLHFKKVVLIWLQPFTQDLVEKVKPDIVVECNVSRFIGSR